jgi:hypothetical protein
MGAGAVALLGLTVAATFGGVEPLPGAVTCYHQHFGPVATALLADQGPWPADWPAFFAASGVRELVGAGRPDGLRCPDDTARAGADPLVEASFALMAGLERDMPPILLACWEREARHVWTVRYRDGGTGRRVTAWVQTLGGGDRLAVDADVPPGVPEAEVQQRVQVRLTALVHAHAVAVAVAREHAACAAGDGGARARCLAALAHADHRTRACAAWALARAGCAEAVPALQVALRRESQLSAREEIARALALLGDRAGVEALLSALAAAPSVGGEPGDPAPPHVRRDRAHAALRRLAGRDWGHPADPAALAAWQAWGRGA